MSVTTLASVTGIPKVERAHSRRPTNVLVDVRDGDVTYAIKLLKRRIKDSGVEAAVKRHEFARRRSQLRAWKRRLAARKRAKAARRQRLRDVREAAWDGDLSPQRRRSASVVPVMVAQM